MENPGNKAPRNEILNFTIIGVVAQLGCVTLVIVLAAVFGGLWLDAQFLQGKHWFTAGLLFASIPVSILSMLYLARLAVSKIKAGSDKAKSD
jgi:hypothetical protein